MKDPFYYRAESTIIWHQRATWQLLSDEFDLTKRHAERLLQQLSDDIVISRNQTQPGGYEVLIPRPQNSNSAEGVMQRLFATAVRVVREHPEHVNHLLIEYYLGVDRATAIKLLHILTEMHVLERTHEYRVLNWAECEQQGGRWFDPFYSSVQEIDDRGVRQMRHVPDEPDGRFEVQLDAQMTRMQRRDFNVADDDMYSEVVHYIVQLKLVSASMLQRKFRFGFARTCRILDQLEADGFIGPADGVEPHQVLKKPEDLSD